MSLEEKYLEKLQWFIERIGNRVWRKTNSCKCNDCARVVKNGLIISNKNHAIYLTDVSSEMGIKYYDKKP